jgi:hypothetical protein
LEEILKGVSLNSHYEFNIWYCKEILSEYVYIELLNFVKIENMVLHNILDYPFKNLHIIIDCIKEGSYAKAADIISVEKYFAGIYLDTDIKHTGPYKPSLPRPCELNMKYDIQTSFELDPPNDNCLLVGPSNSVLVVPYKSEIMNEYSIKPETSSITKSDIVVSEESMNLERNIMSSTGPYALSEAINNVLKNNISLKDNPIHILRNTSNIKQYSLHQIVTCDAIYGFEKNDATCIPELRKKLLGLYNYLLLNASLNQNIMVYKYDLVLK